MRENFDTDEMFEPERAELGEKPRYRFKLNRRHFLEVTGAGLLITAMVEVAPGQRRRGEPVTLATRLHIAEDGTVTILTGKVEIGQGSRTQITQAAAEEMGIPAEEVRLVMADTKLVPNDGATSGSRTTPQTVPSVRRAAAAARELFVARACAEWNTQPNRVELVGGAVQEKSTKRRLTYASLARSDELASAYQEAVPSDVTVRSVSDWNVLGASVEKVGGWNIVTGAHRFPSDIQRPNMLYGRLLRPLLTERKLPPWILRRRRTWMESTLFTTGTLLGAWRPPLSARRRPSKQSARPPGGQSPSILPAKRSSPI